MRKAETSSESKLGRRDYAAQRSAENRRGGDVQMSAVGSDLKARGVSMSKANPKVEHHVYKNHARLGFFAKLKRSFFRLFSRGMVVGDKKRIQEDYFDKLEGALYHENSKEAKRKELFKFIKDVGIEKIDGFLDTVDGRNIGMLLKDAVRKGGDKVVEEFLEFSSVLKGGLVDPEKYKVVKELFNLKDGKLKLLDFVNDQVGERPVLSSHKGYQKLLNDSHEDLVHSIEVFFKIKKGNISERDIKGRSLAISEAFKFRLGGLKDREGTIKLVEFIKNVGIGNVSKVLGSSSWLKDLLVFKDEDGGLRVSEDFFKELINDRDVSEKNLETILSFKYDGEKSLEEIIFKGGPDEINGLLREKMGSEKYFKRFGKVYPDSIHGKVYRSLNNYESDCNIDDLLVCEEELGSEAFDGLFQNWGVKLGSFKGNYGWLSDGFKVRPNDLDTDKDRAKKTLEICQKIIGYYEGAQDVYVEEMMIRSRTVLNAIQNVEYHPSSVRMEKDSSKSGAFHAVYFGRIDKGAGERCVLKPIGFNEEIHESVVEHQEIEERESHLIGRNMVVAELASKMGAGDLIVKTRPTLIDGGDGFLKLGLAMDEAQGVEALDRVFEEKTGRLLMEDGNFRKAITQMDWLDRLCWQIDRHYGNFFIKADESGIFEGLKGIDNDICLGGKKDPLVQRTGKALTDIGYCSVFSLPHVIDVDTAECLLSLKDRDIDEMCNGRLNSSECEALKFRLGKIQKHIERLKGDGRVIENTKEAWGEAVVDKWLSEQPEPPEGYASLYGKDVWFTGQFAKIRFRNEPH